MLVRWLIAALLTLAPFAAEAACVPGNAPPGSIGCYPDRVTVDGPLEATDMMPIWVPSAFPNSQASVTLGELSLYFSSGGGFVVGPPSSVVGQVPTWNNSTGSLLGSGLVAGTTGNNVLVMTNGLGLIDPSTLPDPGATTLGGVKSLVPGAHNFLTSIDTTGTPTAAQPAFTDITGTASNAQLANSSMTFGGQSVSLGASAAVQGNGAKVQLSTGTPVTNNCAKFDANHNTIDAGAPCSATGWQEIGVTTVTAAAGSGTIALPSGYRRYRVTVQGATVGTAAGQLQLIVSINGGTSFITTASYAWESISINGATVSGNSTTLSNIPLSPPLGTAGNGDFVYEIFPGAASNPAHVRGTHDEWSSTPAWSAGMYAAAVNVTSPVNAIQINCTPGVYTASIILEGLL